LGVTLFTGHETIVSDTEQQETIVTEYSAPSLDPVIVLRHPISGI
jgi:hypothetical protein